MTFDPNTPFNQLPYLPPPGDLETKAVLKACIEATRALSELKAASDLIPNPTMLINAIPLQEAKLSSEIENIVTTDDKLYRADANGDAMSTDPNTKEVLRYRATLRHGFESLDRTPLCPSSFHEICSRLRGVDVDVRAVPGTALKNEQTGEPVYTPPDGVDRLRGLLANLAGYIHADDGVDSLIKAAVMHYQFEAIHPYHDGNGRTGRVLLILYLVERGLLRLPVLYLSRFIIEHKGEYYRRLRGVTEDGAWEPWILFLLLGMRETSELTTAKVREIKRLFDETCEKARTEMSRASYSKELIELLFVQPYCKIQFLVDAGLGQRQAASRYLRELERIGVLDSVKIGREKFYINPALVRVLSE